MFTLRPGDVDDLPFLRHMLMQAYHWNYAGPIPPEDEFLAQPHIRERLEGWRPHDGDRAVIAELNGRSVGAVWFRFYTDDRHAYGYIDLQTPEVGIGVTREHRSRGIGRSLLQALIDVARQEGVQALSLSVDPSNHARRLYESMGFERVSKSGTSLTMRLGL